MSTPEIAHRRALTLGHPAVITPDLDRFRRFYEDVIGLRLTVIDHPLRAPYRRVGSFTDATGSSVVLAAYEIPHHRTELADDLLGRRGRIDHLAFVVHDDAALAAVATRLVDAGASSGATDGTGWQQSLHFVDPDGAHHVVQIRRDVAQHSEHTELVDQATPTPTPSGDSDEQRP